MNIVTDRRDPSDKRKLLHFLDERRIRALFLLAHIHFCVFFVICIEHFQKIRERIRGAASKMIPPVFLAEIPENPNNKFSREASSGEPSRR